MHARSKIVVFSLVLQFANVWGICGQLAQETSIRKGNKIVIGLLLEDSVQVEARFGAEFAVKEINRSGGLKGRSLALSFRSMEGSWGVGSTKAVDLVFDQKALALVGLLNGRNSHLVEQVAAKTDVPFVSAWAADPTLSRAYVPQFFNCVPNSEQQAQAILGDLREKGQSNAWMLVSDDDYDSRIAVQGLTDLEIYANSPPRKHVKCNTSDDFEAIVQMIRSQRPQALVVFCEPGRSLKLIRFLRSNQLTLPVYSHLNILQERNFASLSEDRLESVYFCAGGTWMSDRDSEFVKAFSAEFDRYPGVMAAYAYDAIHILAEAILRSDLDRSRLKQSLSHTRYEGKTGAVEFDRFGNRKSTLTPGVISSEILSASKP